jgi:hypothetical protein
LIERRPLHVRTNGVMVLPSCRIGCPQPRAPPPCRSEALAVYPNWDDLRREYPELEPEDIRQALEFAARNLDESVQPLELA